MAASRSSGACFKNSLEIPSGPTAFLFCMFLILFCNSAMVNALFSSWEIGISNFPRISFISPVCLVKRFLKWFYHSWPFASSGIWLYTIFSPNPFQFFQKLILLSLDWSSLVISSLQNLCFLESQSFLKSFSIFLCDCNKDLSQEFLCLR